MKRLDSYFQAVYLVNILILNFIVDEYRNIQISFGSFATIFSAKNIFDLIFQIQNLSNYRIPWNVGASDFELVIDIERNKDGRIFLEIAIYVYIRISVVDDFDLEIGENEESILPFQKLVEMGAILRAPVDVKRTTANDDIHVAVLESSEMQRSGEAGSF